MRVGFDRPKAEPEREMPTKHIPDSTWRKVEKETVRAVIELQSSVTETKMLNWLILKGLSEITPEDYREFSKKKAEE